MTSKFAEALAVVNGQYKPPVDAPPSPGTPSYAEVYAKYQAETRAAVKFHDPNWSNSAIMRERHKRVHAAREELRQALNTSTTQATADPNTARMVAFEQIATTDASSVAVATNEWGKVRVLLDAGRNLSQIIDTADRRRLSAILDHLDSDLAIQTDDPVGVAAEVSQAVLVRLAALGDPKAQEAIVALESAQHGAAWQQVIEQAANGQVTADARAALHRANAHEYRAAFDDGDLEAAEIDQAIANLDALRLDSEEVTSG